MDTGSDVHVPETDREAFWIATSFFAHKYEVQTRIIAKLIINKNMLKESSELGKPFFDTLFSCFNRYFTEKSSEVHVVRTASELGALFDFIQDYAFWEIKAGGGSILMWLDGLNEDGESGGGWNKQLWMLVKRLARQVLDEWGSGYYPFEKVGMISLDKWMPDDF